MVHKAGSAATDPSADAAEQAIRDLQAGAPEPDAQIDVPTEIPQEPQVRF